MIAFSVTASGRVVAVVRGSKYTFDEYHPAYETLRDAINDSDEDSFLSVIDKRDVVKLFTAGRVTVCADEILFDKKPIRHIVAERILDLMGQGFDFKPMARFLNNLMQNTSSSSVEEVFKFLENKELAITPDGHFIAYKAITHDWLDKWSRKIDNSIGQKPKKDRRDVDDSRRKACSFGLHVGSINYVEGYSNGSTDRLIMVKVNPRDVVSVNHDASVGKIRVCEYEVLQEINAPLETAVYDDGSEPAPIEDTIEEINELALNDMNPAIFDEESERDFLSRLLANHNGVKAHAAKALGIPRSTFFDRLKRAGIS